MSSRRCDRFWVALAAAVLSAGVARGADELRLPSLIERTLPSGVRVIVCPLPGHELVDVRVMVGVGSATEGRWAGSGAAHLFEHLIGGGSTEDRDASDIRTRVRALGGLYGAHTDLDRTWFELRTTPDGVPEAIEILADQVQHPRFAAAEIEAERAVVDSERVVYAGQGPRRSFELVHELLFPDSPARFPILGDPARFAGLTAEDLRSFHAEHYAPSNLVVCVAGDVDPPAIHRQVEAAFDAAPAAPRASPSPAAVVAPAVRRYAEEHGGTGGASVTLGWSAPALDHTDAAAMELLARWHGDRSYDGIARRVSREVGALATVQCVARVDVPSVWVIMATVDPERVSDLERVAREEIERLSAESVEQSLAQLQRGAVTERALQLQESAALGQQLATDALRTGDPRFGERRARSLLRVTASDLERVSRRYLGSPPAVAVVRPSPASSDDSGPADVAVERDATLPNGVRLRTRADPASPAIGVCLVLRASPHRDDAESAYAAMAASIMAHATGTSIDELRAGGARVSSFVDRFGVGVTVEATASDHASIADAIAELLEGLSELDDANFVRELAAWRDVLRRRRGDYRVAVDDAVDRAWFPDAPVAYGDGAVADSLTLEGLRKYAESRRVGGNVVIGAAGGLSHDAWVAGLTHSLAGLRQGDGSPPPAVRAATHRPAEPVDLPSPSPDATVVLAYRGVGVDAPDRAGLDLLDAYLTGRRAPSGPLPDALRSAPVSAYLVDGWHRPMPGDGVFVVVVRCAPERVDVAIAEMKRVLSEAGQAVTAEEVAHARAVLMTSRASVEEKAVHRARLLATAELYGLSAGRRSYLDQVAEIDQARMKDLARRVFPGPWLPGREQTPGGASPDDGSTGELLVVVFRPVTVASRGSTDG